MIGVPNFDLCPKSKCIALLIIYLMISTRFLCHIHPINSCYPLTKNLGFVVTPKRQTGGGKDAGTSLHRQNPAAPAKVCGRLRSFWLNSCWALQCWVSPSWGFERCSAIFGIVILSEDCFTVPVGCKNNWVSAVAININCQFIVHPHKERKYKNVKAIYIYMHTKIL